MFVFLFITSLTFKHLSKSIKHTFFFSFMYMHEQKFIAVCEYSCIHLTLRIYYEVGVGVCFLGVKEQIILTKI